MFFKTQTRVNPQTGELSTYYRLVESYRNVLGEVRQRSILSAGFMEGVTPEEIWSIAEGLNARLAGVRFKECQFTFAGITLGFILRAMSTYKPKMYDRHTRPGQFFIPAIMVVRLYSHNIAWWLDGAGHELNETDEQHICAMLEQNFYAGELCSTTSDGGEVYVWWNIKRQ